jgi:CRISPR/Cas system-associated exonuclease Cas4 (RecB family)
VEISIDEIYKYLDCPAKYKFKYKDGLNPEETKSVLYKEALHKTIYFFFFTAMNGFVPTLAQMKDKWSNLWEEAAGRRDIMEELLSVREPYIRKLKGHRDPDMDKYRMAGFEMIYNFYNFNKDNPGNIIGVDMPYRVPIGDITVTGNFELLREIVDAADGKRYIEIVDFKTNSDSIDPFLVKHDFNLTMASYAFRNTFQGQEDRVKYHYLKTGRDIIVTKEEDDYNRMKSIVEGVVKGIENELFYPRQTFMCKSCNFKDVCDRVKF